MKKKTDRNEKDHRQSETPANIEFSMSLLAALVVEEIAQKKKKKKSDVLEAFMKSNTAEMLYDQGTGLWTCGPTYIEDEYQMEIAAKRQLRKTQETQVPVTG